MPESSSFRTSLKSQRVHGCKTLLKLSRQHFHPNFPLSQDKLSQKTSLLLECEILGLFGTTLTADLTYSRHNSNKFAPHVKMPLSQKLQTFSGTFIAFLESSAFFKNRPASQLKNLESYLLQRTWLPECRKASLLEHLWRVNVFTSAKHF